MPTKRTKHHESRAPGAGARAVAGVGVVAGGVGGSIGSCAIGCSVVGGSVNVWRWEEVYIVHVSLDRL